MMTLELLKARVSEEQEETFKNIQKYIKCDPDVMDGLPVFVGTRVPVHIVFECLAEGMSPEQILKAFPTLEPEHIPAALKFSSLLAAIH